MNLLEDKISILFRKYFLASLGGALVVSAYSLIDCIMVGQYEGPNGVAALATVMPIWNMILSVGLLFGIGGSILLSTSKGAENEKEANGYFTVAMSSLLVIALLIWVFLSLHGITLLRFFGADDILLPLAERYLFWIQFAVPFFIIGQALLSFVRNDGAPMLTSLSVILGGVFNIIGDYYFVFVCDMGVNGAGLATMIGQLIGFMVLCTHFLSKKCTLRFVKPNHWFKKIKKVITAGFPTFIVDISMGIMTLLFNRQIMHYYNTNVLSVYGVIANVVMTVQALAYAVGQAAQPIISVNYGAKKAERIHSLRLLGIKFALGIGASCCVLSLLFPTQLIHLFMDATPEVLSIAPAIMRPYFSSFLLLGFNIYATYYFQAVLQPKAANVISLLRSILISGLLIYLLPLILGKTMLWWVMPITETVVAGVSAFLMRRQREI